MWSSAMWSTSMWQGTEEDLSGPVFLLRDLSFPEGEVDSSPIFLRQDVTFPEVSV